MRFIVRVLTLPVAHPLDKAAEEGPERFGSYFQFVELDTFHFREQYRSASQRLDG